MLIGNASSFGKTLSRSEYKAALAESEYKAFGHYRLQDHELRKQSWRKRGHLHASEFILRLKRINPNLFIQRQINYPNEWGVYADVRGKLTYLSAFRKGWVQEFSYTLVDDHDNDIEEVRGWRSCLVRLLNYGVITWEQVQTQFGDAPGNGGAAWRKNTRKHRCGNGRRVAVRNLINKLTLAY